jgi:hypothetical protein
MTKTAAIPFQTLLGGLFLALRTLIPAASAATPRADTASVRRIFGGYVSRYRQSPNIMEIKPAIRVGQESMVPVRYQVQHVKVLDNL